LAGRNFAELVNLSASRTLCKCGTHNSSDWTGIMRSSGGVEIDRDTGVSAEASGGHDYAELFRAENAKLYRSLYAYTGGRRDIAEDATVEAFARAISEGERVRDPLPWLYRTAFRIAAAELKGDRKRGERKDEVADPPDEAAVEVLAGVRALSPQQRTAVVLHYLVDLPVEDVAKRMGVSTSAVKVHLFRARKHLRELLGDEEAVTDD
jgi:RNA polymerase sigma-70 factor (ECF subfamily)